MAVPSALLLTLFLACSPIAHAQFPTAQMGEVVPRDVREVYEKGLQYLAKTQTEDGDWRGGQGGPGVTGMAVMAFLASGEDPNFGIYSGNIRRGLRSILLSQDSATGIYGGAMGHTSMYNHGFAMLAIAESYGAVDDSDLWRGSAKQSEDGTGMTLGHSPCVVQSPRKRKTASGVGGTVLTRPMRIHPSVAP